MCGSETHDNRLLRDASLSLESERGEIITPAVCVCVCARVYCYTVEVVLCDVTLDCQCYRWFLSDCTDVVGVFNMLSLLDGCSVKYQVLPNRTQRKIFERIGLTIIGLTH